MTGENLFRQELLRGRFDPFDDAAFVSSLEKFNKSQLVITGLWSEGCVSLAAMAGLKIGHEVSVAVDCVGSANADAHYFALQRLIQAGCVPVS